MGTTPVLSERPSVPPATAVSRVRPLPADPQVSVGRENVTGAVRRVVGRDVAVTALRVVRLFGDAPFAGPGSSVPTAHRVPTTTVQLMQIKQIDALPAYRVEGVAGVPPRGRPN